MNELDKLIADASAKEHELELMSNELASQNEMFAKYLASKKRADAELEVLWQMVKDYMIENNIKNHSTPGLTLALTPSGKYRADDIESVSDDLCDIKKTLNNKKVKAYMELNGELPEGVESTGYILRKKIINGD